MLRIESVLPRTPASRAGFKPRDSVAAINRQPVTDVIDLSFATADEVLEVTGERDGKPRAWKVSNPRCGDIGLVAEPHRVRLCNNQCLFCFVDQMPVGLRSTLYVKDEDYRLSFLDGAYICATNLTRADFDRIASLRLSPLYISVHATDEVVRQRLLGNAHAPSILEILNRFKSDRISFHTQIVLCPDINDGRVLDKTLDDLDALGASCLSIAVVPVGLSQYRDSLFNIKPVTPSYAVRMVKIMVQRQKKSGKKNRLFLADEWYLRAGLPFPSAAHYGDYPQIENGVGMMRSFTDEFKRMVKTRKFKKRHGLECVISGMSAGHAVSLLFKALGRKNGVTYRTLSVENRLMGKSVTVSGLLSGRDMMDAVKATGSDFDRVILPPNCLNSDNLTLDGFTLSDLAAAFKAPVCVPGSAEEIP